MRAEMPSAAILLQVVRDRAVKPRLAPVSGRNRDGDGFRVDIEAREQWFFFHVLVVCWFFLW